MSEIKVERGPINITIKLEKNEAVIIKDLFGAMNDETVTTLLKGTNHRLTTALGLTAEIYYDLDRTLDKDDKNDED